MRRRGFSLIELMIVIVLIALLLALLIPGLAAARRLAARTDCQNNLRLIFAGMNNYSSDHSQWPRRNRNVKYPFQWSNQDYTDAGGNVDKTYYDKLFTRYLTDPKVFYCPSNSHDWAPPDTEWSKSWSDDQRRFSYTILDGMPGPANIFEPGNPQDDNVWLTNYVRQVKIGSEWEPTLEPTRPTMGSDWEKINAPVAGDLIWRKGDTADSEIISANHVLAANANPPGMNIVYFDGSVRWVVPEQEDDDPDVADRQGLFRPIWREKNNSYVWFIWWPDRMHLDYEQ